MRRATWLLLAAVSTAGCGSSDDAAASADTSSGGTGAVTGAPSGLGEPVDMRTDLPDPAAGGLQFVSGEYVLEPGDDKVFCHVETYTGPDVGIRGVTTYQDGPGHHVAFLSTSASPEQYADGESFDCTSTEDFDMTLLSPLFLGTGVVVDGVNGVTLPEGMAALMRSGTRILIQSHYINTTTDTLRVQDGANVEVVPESDVETWAAPFVTSDLTFEILPQQDLELEFDCTLEQETNFLYLAGHMHEWGREFHIDRKSAAGDAVERVYEVQQWEAEFRDQAPLAEYEAGAFTLGAGDVLTTGCSWSNDTDGSLVFPNEMCAVFGMIYPARDPVVCANLE